MSSFSYFIWFGTFSLILLTWQDFKNNMLIDDRRNAFMMGMAASLISRLGNFNIWYLLGLTAIILITRSLLLHFNTFGEGDINTLAWIFYGLAIIHINYFIGFFTFLIIITAIYNLFKTFIFKIDNETPFMIAILITFISYCGLMGLY